MFNPDLINKFQQNLRMAQIHSNGGVNEENIDAIETYLYSALIYLKELDGNRNKIIEVNKDDLIVTGQLEVKSEEAINPDNIKDKIINK